MSLSLCNGGGDSRSVMGFINRITYFVGSDGTLKDVAHTEQAASGIEAI